MIIWLASYPKSGNTWMRALLSAYLFSDSGKFNFELMKNIAQFSSKNLTPDTLKSSNYQAKISENWIPYQKIINKDKKIHILKTHNALCVINDNKFTDQFNTLAAIYIVRDPRNLITSLVHHYEFSFEQAFSFITNKKKIIFPKNIQEENKTGSEPDDFNFLGDWSDHYKSWKNINFCPIKIIKYEDILIDTKKVFISTLEFLSKFMKLDLDEKKINNSLITTSFKHLRKMEEESGFFESVTSLKKKKQIKFFNLGKKNDWKKLLDDRIIKKIENNFKNAMSQLNYL